MMRYSRLGLKMGCYKKKVKEKKQRDAVVVFFMTLGMLLTGFIRWVYVRFMRR